MQFSHLQKVADKIPPVEDQVPIILLLGRDIIQVHKIRERINGPHSTPYAQRLDLGWVIVGEACLGKTHKPPNANVLKTHVLQNGRAHVLTSFKSKSQVVTATPLLPTKTRVKVSILISWDKQFLKERKMMTNQCCQYRIKTLLTWKRKCFKMKVAAGWHRCHSALQDHNFQVR